jgi:hypothetical protein
MPLSSGIVSVGGEVEPLPESAGPGKAGVGLRIATGAPLAVTPIADQRP